MSTDETLAVEAKCIQIHLCKMICKIVNQTINSFQLFTRKININFKYSLRIDIMCFLDSVESLLAVLDLLYLLMAQPTG